MCINSSSFLWMFKNTAVWTNFPCISLQRLRFQKNCMMTCWMKYCHVLPWYFGTMLPWYVCPRHVDKPSWVLEGGSFHQGQQLWSTLVRRQNLVLRHTEEWIKRLTTQRILQWLCGCQIVDFCAMNYIPWNSVCIKIPAMVGSGKVRVQNSRVKG